MENDGVGACDKVNGLAPVAPAKPAGALRLCVFPPSQMDVAGGGSSFDMAVYAPGFRKPAGSKTTVHYGPVLRLDMTAANGLQIMAQAQVVLRERADGSFDLKLETVGEAAPKCLQ